MGKKLYRSSTNRVIAGVCGGIGEYFNIDPVIIRLLVIVFTLMGGSGFIAYIIAFIIIPGESTTVSTMDGVSKSDGNRILKVFLLIVAVVIGFALLAMLLGIFRWSLGMVFHELRF